MPYIEPIQRERFKMLINLMETVEIRNSGELNYLITNLLHEYIRQNGESYQKYNDCVGSLEGAKLELYRRHIQFYENKKIEENGDVCINDVPFMEKN